MALEGFAWLYRVPLRSFLRVLQTGTGRKNCLEGFLGDLKGSTSGGLEGVKGLIGRLGYRESCLVQLHACVYTWVLKGFLIRYFRCQSI